MLYVRSIIYPLFPVNSLSALRGGAIGFHDTNFFLKYSRFFMDSFIILIILEKKQYFLYLTYHYLNDDFQYFKFEMNIYPVNLYHAIRNKNTIYLIQLQV